MWVTMTQTSQSPMVMDILGSRKDASGAEVRFSKTITLRVNEPQEVDEGTARHLAGVGASGRFTVVVTKKNPGPRPVWPKPDVGEV